ncbi:hypothetical protein K1720_03455 [Thermococcus argininiproducens]|uniref:Uncharacterized protein n=1 Tax=Thermococcus argininiproducens TaxID=2866384 RepID=A0A9E7SDE9_9EURY|nr:hypothetical protein [Thermococcus argininiproducens]USH00522.1 hypothetical protein K1720_03455 [Thermococcus argininiproducens]
MSIVDTVIYALLVIVYYMFLKTALEVFTYKKLRNYSILTISILGVVVSLKIDLFLGILVLFIILLRPIKLNLKEALVVALTAEFGFLLGVIVIMFILTTAGTVFGIEGLELNMTWEELFHYITTHP